MNNKKKIKKYSNEWWIKEYNDAIKFFLYAGAAGAFTKEEFKEIIEKNKVLLIEKIGDIVEFDKVVGHATLKKVKKDE